MKFKLANDINLTPVRSETQKCALCGCKIKGYAVSVGKYVGYHHFNAWLCIECAKTFSEKVTPKIEEAMPHIVEEGI